MDTVVHVGLPKTASTFLQRHVFPASPDRKAIVIGVHRSDLVEFVRDMNQVNLDDVRIRAATLDRGRNPLRWPQKRAFWLDAIRTELEKQTSPVLISCEGLVGVSWDPLINNLQIAEFMKEAFSGCKIFFVFRRQDEWAVSLYKHFVYKEDRFRKHLAFHELFGFDGNAVTNIENLNWHKVWSNYRAVFGSENVLALPYEMLVSDPTAFVRALEVFADCRFEIDEAVFGIRENISCQCPVYQESRLFMGENNRLVENVMRWPRVARGLKALSLAGAFRRHFECLIPFEPVAQEVCDLIVNCHEQDNRLLARGVGIPLEDYGYFRRS